MLGSRGVPSLQGFSHAKRALKFSKSMQWSNNHACFAVFDPSTWFEIPDMFFLTGFTQYITQMTIGM